MLLARALCATQKLLLLDEPVNGLDPKVSAEFYDIIRELNRKDGIAVIMVSHDMTNGLRDAKHVLYLEEDAQYFTDIETFRESEQARRLRGEIPSGAHLREVRQDG